MFQSVRQNSPLYIFHKGDNIRLEIAYVANQPVPRAKYPMPTAFGQPQEMIVDLSAKIGEQTFNYNGLPANLDIADSFSNGETITISDSKEAINAEVLSFKQKSSDALKNTDYHKRVITTCDKILSDLNPEFAENKQRNEEIAGLKNQVSEMSKSIEALMESNRQLMERFTKN